MKKRIICFVIFLAALAFAVTPVLPAAAAANSDPVISVDDVYVVPGETVDIHVLITDNPGILGATLKLTYDSKLTLTEAKNGSAFSVLSLTKPGTLKSNCKFVWDGQELAAGDIKDGTILTLTFKVSNKASSGDSLSVVLSYDTGAIVDGKFKAIKPTVKNGKVMVFDYKPGDLNGDKTVNTQDLVLLRRYIAGGYGVTINTNAADVNNDGSINTSDVILIRRYIAGGYADPITGKVPLILRPSTANCDHSLIAFKAKAPTATEPGNIAYWRCNICGKYFSDAKGTKEITQEETVLEPTGNKHKITYEIANGDPYLATLLANEGIDNSENPTEFTEASGVPSFEDLSVEGYKFLGWFNGAGANATQVESIPAGTKTNIKLYAHWEEITYKITYNLYQTPVTSEPSEEQKCYTVSKGNYNLYNPEINNYIFLGWYDKDGVEYKNIPVGTTGDIVLNTYYTSQRNLAVSKVDNNPIIVEDQKNNVVYFTYEIGEIRNIPLTDKPYWEIQSVAGLNQQVSKEYTRTTSETYATSIAKTVSDMTVSSNTWTLAKTWDEAITVNESCMASHENRTEDCKEQATTSSGTLSITNQQGGSSYHKTEDGSTVYDYNSKIKTNEKGHQFDASLNGTYSNKISANLGKTNEYGTEGSYNVSNSYTKQGQITAENWSASGSQEGSENGSAKVSDKDKYSAGIGYENGYEINAGMKYGYHNNTQTVTKTGSDTVTVNSEIDENTSSWNNSATFAATNTSSVNQSVRNTLSDIVTTTKGYGKSYSNTETNSNTQGFSSTSSETSGTTSTTTYSTMKSEKTTSTYSVDGHIEGTYRCILVGTAHVFGVVGYDYNTKSYFTYTFSVMDDKTKVFLDYTPKDGDFTDCENSCLPFEIPSDVYDYVNDRTVRTAGVEFTTNSAKGTAKIVNYSGSSSDVIIPSYVSDGKQAYKVTEIASSAFAGKSVRAVVLGEFIESIPAGAFKNCTKLEGVIGSFTEIGDEAFAGCVNLTDMNIPSNVVKIGKDAFEGANSINVRAINSLCAYAEAVKELPNGTDDQLVTKQRKITRDYINSVLHSGAQNITIDLSLINLGTQLTLEAPAINSLEINGGGKIFNNFSLKSDAGSTALSEMTISNTNTIPLIVGSEKLTLHKVFIKSNATALIMKKAGAVLSLNQDSAIESPAQYAIVSKNPEVKAEVASGGATGSLNVSGIFGYIKPNKGQDAVHFTDGDWKEMTDEEFKNYVKGVYTITFDANGGQCSKTSDTRIYGEPVGTLPTPTKEFCDFEGWFADGTSVTEESTFSGDQTLIAHWKQKDVTDWVPASSVPSGAQIVNTKWKYDLTSYTTSSYSSLSGWEQYNTTWVWSDYGGWSSWVDYYVASSESRDVESRYISPTYKTQYYYSRYQGNGKTGPWAGTWGGVYCGTLQETGWLDQAKPYYGSEGSFEKWGVKGDVWYNQQTRTVEVTPGYTQYRWRDRSKVYTYYYKKIEAKESISYPSGSNISNIVEWVQYRER